jgi:hypothetical protein
MHTSNSPGSKFTSEELCLPSSAKRKVNEVAWGMGEGVRANGPYLMTYHVCNEEMLNVDQIIRIPMDDGRWMDSGIWSLLGLTRSKEKSISIVKMRKEWKGCGWGTSADGRPVAAW